MTDLTTTTYAAVRITIDSAHDFGTTRARFDERVPLFDQTIALELGDLVYFNMDEGISDPTPLVAPGDTKFLLICESTPKRILSKARRLSQNGSSNRSIFSRAIPRWVAPAG